MTLEFNPNPIHDLLICTNGHKEVLKTVGIIKNNDFHLSDKSIINYEQIKVSS